MSRFSCAGASSGFTLIELLVSITLVAVIVMILSLGLRSGLRAWTRGRESNRLMARITLERLLGAQLRALARNEGSSMVDMARFEGNHREMVFTTTHVPMGTEEGGIFKVVYRYYPEERRLLYAQKLITTQEDLRENLPDTARAGDEDLLKAGWLVSELTDVPAAGFDYLAKAEKGRFNEWEEEWKRPGAVPGRVALCWGKQNPGEDGTDCTVFTTTPLDF